MHDFLKNRRRFMTAMAGAGAAFGLWSFVSKFTLAFAAVVLLPSLDASGFVSGTHNSQGALDLLTYLYALVPCVLKFGAIALLATTRMPRHIEGDPQSKEVAT